MNHAGRRGRHLAADPRTPGPVVAAGTAEVPMTWVISGFTVVCPAASAKRAVGRSASMTRAPFRRLIPGRRQEFHVNY